MSCRGEPVFGQVHTTDASSGVAIPIYNVGSTDARTLASNEYLEVTASRSSRRSAATATF